MAARTLDAENLHVDQRTLARILSVSVRTVQRYEDDGLSEARVGDSATYDLPAAVAWYADKKAERTTDDDATEYEKARTQRTIADARIKEDELATRRGKLIPIDEVADKVRQPLEAVDARLRSAPRTLAASWAERIGVTQAEAIAMIGELTEEIRSDIRLVFEDESGDAAA